MDREVAVSLIDLERGMPFGRGQRDVRNLGEAVERRIRALDELVARGACRLAAGDRVVHAFADRFVALEGLLVGSLDGLDNLLRYARSGEIGRASCRERVW